MINIIKGNNMWKKCNLILSKIYVNLYLKMF